MASESDDAKSAAKEEEEEEDVEADPRASRRRHRRRAGEDDGGEDDGAGGARGGGRSRTRERDVSRSRSKARSLSGTREGGRADRILRDPTLQAAMANNLKRKALKMAENRPEIHVIGEIVGSTGFPSGVSCKWAMATGEKWTVLNGEVSGQTHTDYPTSDMAVWAHPIDVHYVAGTVHGWPRISVQVWKLDEYGRNEIQAYGFVHVPSTAGSFDLEISTWRPLGSHGVEVAGFFLGSKPQLASADMIVKDISDRYRLTTEAAGTVYVHVDVLFKNLELHHVEW